MFVLAAYRLISPGSEWRLHRQWYGRELVLTRYTELEAELALLLERLELTLPPQPKLRITVAAAATAV